MREGFMLKRIFLKNNPIVLLLSFLFLLTHSVFSWLAFKNDLSFWRKNKSMKGLSARSMVISWVCRLIITLYLLDSRETSYIILFEIAMDLFLSTWKLTKAVTIEFGPKKASTLSDSAGAVEDAEVVKEVEGKREVEDVQDEGMELATVTNGQEEVESSEVRNRKKVAKTKTEEVDPNSTQEDLVSSSTSPKFVDAASNSGMTAKLLAFLEKHVIRIKSRHGYEDDKTSEYDAIAIKYMSYLLYPLMLGYTIYSLFYNEHKSWYSFCLKTFAGYIYMFGFIMMTPQLYINYRLKSVEHMPWRAMTYKALNTFVDDVSAFLMDMPWMHRLSCLRDDVIFIAYLYQRWAYAVDKTRPNAYTDEGLEQVEDEKKKKEELDPAKAMLPQLLPTTSEEQVEDEE